VKRAIVASLLSIASLSRAAPVERYNEAVAPRAQAPLEARIVALVAEVATRERREAPRPDARLERAAEDLARHTPPDGRPPNEQVQAALWLNGIVEPPPHLIVATTAPGAEGDEAVLKELRVQLPVALSQGRYRRVGVSAQPFLGPCAQRRVGCNDQVLVLVALQESGLELEPMPRALLNGGPAPLVGQLHAPFERPEAFVTSPDGQVTRLPLDGDVTHFRGTFHCGPSRGRYQLELAGEDRFGSSVLANFPIYCGVPAPAALPAPQPISRADERLTDGPAAEAALVRLVNQDRVRAGLPPLQMDARLSAVARAHSADMQAHGFVGHLSPTTGSASDRLRRAGIDAALIAENVARAYSPGEAERGLMESPGHRANILNREVTRIGVGAIISDGVGGARELLATQLFMKVPERLDAGSLRELKRAIDELRRTHGLKTLETDGALDQVAQSTAEGVAKGALKAERAGEPIERELGKLADRYKSMRSVVAASSGVTQVVGGVQKSLLDPEVTTIGAGLAEGHRPDGSPALFAVLVLATRR
jgi:uncharacterized protein YkwD